MTTLLEKQEMAKDVERLRGNVQLWFPEKQYGFIRVIGVLDERTGKQKQWHFHLNSVSASQWGLIATRVAVEFTPKPSPSLGKQDKAADVVVVVVG